jgi:uncharacterized membrane protein YgcG
LSDQVVVWQRRGGILVKSPFYSLVTSRKRELTLPAPRQLSWRSPNAWREVMATIRSLTAIIAASLALAACAADPPGPAGMILPGKDKTAAAFQLDQEVCQQHALSRTGFGGPSAPGPIALGPTQLAPSAPAPSASAPTASALSPSDSANQAGPVTGAAAASPQPSGDVGFMQCMAARGDTVQMAQVGYPYPYPAPYPYPYPYPYGYAYPYAYPGGGIFFGGFGFHDRFHRGFNRGGFHGFHGGGFHGGGFHGGGFHGGGGHR